MLNVGSSLLAFPLWRAATVPSWVPISLAVVTVVPASRGLDFVQAGVIASFIAVARYAWRFASR